MIKSESISSNSMKKSCLDRFFTRYGHILHIFIFVLLTLLLISAVDQSTSKFAYPILMTSTGQTMLHDIYLYYVYYWLTTFSAKFLFSLVSLKWSLRYAGVLNLSISIGLLIAQLMLKDSTDIYLGVSLGYAFFIGIIDLAFMRDLSELNILSSNLLYAMYGLGALAAGLFQFTSGLILSHHHVESYFYFNISGSVLALLFGFMGVFFMNHYRSKQHLENRRFS